MDKMVMYNASAIHPALGPRADQIGVSKGESGNHQVIMACDVIFRVGAEEPTGQGEQQTVVGMNGYSL